MNRTRSTLVWIWLATTVVVAIAAVLWYRSATRVPILAGRTDPSALWEDPTLLFADPGLLGTAVELRVTEAVRACMEEKGQTFRGPAVAQSIYELLDPARDGYGIAAGGATPRPNLGSGGPSSGDRSEYETALYGTSLELATSGDGGCAAVGYQALETAVNTLEGMPYTVDQLEIDAQSDPDYVLALEAWASCMAQRGHSASSPDELMERQATLLATVGGDEARALGDEEREIAVDDFECRSLTIDTVVRQVAERLAPMFVERNRTELETLIPRPGGADLPSGLGSGDVQVTLIWTSKADLDLAVTDPSLEEVYYSNPTASSGGTLDRDANYPCNTDSSSPAAENIYWPTGAAPSGDYRASVIYTSDCSREGVQTFDLIIQVGGVVVHQQRHTLQSAGDRVDIDFTVGSK